MGSRSPQPAARLGDIGSLHQCNPPTPVIVGSGDVQCNGRPVARQGDALVPHACPKSPPHPRSIAEGAGSVQVNGKPWARVTDAIGCGGKLITGSSDTLVGDKPNNRNPILDPEWDRYCELRRAKNLRDPFTRQQLAASLAVEYRGPEGGIASWQAYYAGADAIPNPESLDDPLQRQGAALARAEAAEQAALPAPPPVDPWPPYTPPASFADAIARLDAAAERIKRNGGYTPRYSDHELEAMAEEPVTDRYIARVMPARHLRKAQGDDFLTGALGNAAEGGGIKYWSTTYQHVEETDHLTRTLLEKSGVDYDPDTDYVLVLIDREQAAREAGSRSFVPTYEKLAAFAASTMPDKFPGEDAAKLLNEGYQARYSELCELAERGPKGRFDLAAKGSRRSFFRAYDIDPAEEEPLLARHQVEKSLGANRHYLGNGLTKNNVAGARNRYGNVETFTHDRTPKTLQHLVNHGVIHIHPLPRQS